MAKGSTVTFKFLASDTGFKRTMQGMQKQAHGLGSTFGKLGGLIGASLSVAGVIDFGKASVEAFSAATTQQLILEDAYKRFPKLADTNIEAMRKLSKALQKKTGYDDDAIAASMGLLGAYKLNGKQIQTLMPLVLDFARKTGTDLPTAVGVFGKALLGQGRGLKQIGINFKDTHTTAGNFAELMSTVSAKVGGYAAKYGGTYAGKVEILKAKFDDLKEAVGQVILPAVSAGMDGLSSAIDSIDPKKLQDSAKGMADMTAAWFSGFQTMQIGWDAEGTALSDFGYSTSSMFTDFGYSTASMFADMHTNIADFQNSSDHMWADFGKNVMGVFQGIGNFWAGVVRGMFSGTVDLINGLIRAFDMLTGAKIPQIHLAAPGSNHAVGGTGKGNKPMAQGGLVKGGHGGIMATIGERNYDELVTPLTPRVLGMMGGSSGDTINIVVHGFVGDENALVRRLKQANINSGKRTGVKFA